ncbi:hypothetical protein ACLOJK_018905 [Asimina triloba]
MMVQSGQYLSMWSWIVTNGIRGDPQQPKNGSVSSEDVGAQGGVDCDIPHCPGGTTATTGAMIICLQVVGLESPLLIPLRSWPRGNDGG